MMEIEMTMNTFYPTAPFTRDNWVETDADWQATDADIERAIELANEAFRYAAEDWFLGVDPDDDWEVRGTTQDLMESISRSFDRGLTAAEIAHWAVSQ